MSEAIGLQSIRFEKAPYIYEGASFVGKKEWEGPLGTLFDRCTEDEMMGEKSWELAESRIQSEALGLLFKKSGKVPEDIRYVFGGDLLAQLMATSFAVRDLGIPLFGLYGACSTFGEAMSLAAMTVAAGFAKDTIAIASSHFASAEKQFRFPLDYGNQRPLSSTTTVTGSGAVIVSNKKGAFDIRIKGITTGKIVDYGVKDSMNMGAVMTPAAADTIYQNLCDFSVDIDYYDKIVTGDLGVVGKRILADLLKDKGVDIGDRHMDCGIEIYDSNLQDTHSGGSGCGCAATTFCAYILKKMQAGEYKRILFVPTGALLSPVSFNEGQTVPGIAHGIVLERV